VRLDHKGLRSRDRDVITRRGGHRIPNVRPTRRGECRNAPVGIHLQRGSAPCPHCREGQRGHTIRDEGRLVRERYLRRAGLRTEQR